MAGAGAAAAAAAGVVTGFAVVFGAAEVVVTFAEDVVLTLLLSLPLPTFPTPNGLKGFRPNPQGQPNCLLHNRNPSDNDMFSPSALGMIRVVGPRGTMPSLSRPLAYVASQTESFLHR